MKDVTPWRGENDTGLEDDDILKALKQRYRAADDMTREWRFECASLMDLDAGRQWDSADLAYLESIGRPALTFNLMGKYIDAVSGLQVANRMQVGYSPREVGDAKINELLTSAADWAHDRCNSGPQHSQAFRDMLVCGLGWCETFVDVQDDPEGKFEVKRRSPLEMWWDPQARGLNLDDARYMIRVRYTTAEVIEEMFPEKADELGVHGMGIEPYETYGETAIHDATNAWRYEGAAMRGEYEERQLPLVDYQWWERRPMVRILSPMGNKDFTPRQWSKLKPILDRQRIQYREYRFRGRQYYRSFAASNIILASGESPYQEGFTYGALTGKYDETRRQWFGLGRPLKEPQLFTNKILSESVYILKTQAKGGLIAERNTFEDPDKAEADWAKPDSIVFVEQGAISGGKLMPKPQSPIPQGFTQMLEFAMRALPEVTGVNLEIMGMASREQSGVLESQRKQSAMTMLQWAFDSFRSFLLGQGKQTATYIRDYMADGRLIRLTGDQGDAQYVPLLKDKLSFDFDVIVEESPTSPNQVERTFAIMRELLPLLQAEGKPIPPEFWEHSPLPRKLAEAFAAQARPDPAQQQKAMQERDAAIQLEMQEKQATIQEKQAKAQAATAQAQLEQQRLPLEVAKLQKDMEAADADILAKRARANRDVAEAEAQRIENSYFARGKAPPVAERKVSNG